MDFDVANVTQSDIAEKTQRRGALRPVTVRQLFKTEIKEELTRRGQPGYCYYLDGNEFSLATFVGYIRNVKSTSDANKTIRIEDGTGEISSTLAIEQDPGTDDPQKWSAGEYARVFGVPRDFNGVRLFQIRFIRPIEDPHEVFFHLMEAMTVTLEHSRGPPPRLYDSQFARTTDLPLPPSQSQPLEVAPTPQPADDSWEDSQISTAAMPSYSDSGDTSDEGDGSTDYYTDPPDSPVEAELSPSPTPVGPLGRNHSYEGHSDSEGGPSSQSSQSTQRPRVQPSDEDEDKRTPRKRPNVRNGDGIPESANKGSDDELDALRLEIQTTLSVSTPPRLRPDPYAGWSPTKRKIMVLLQSRTPGEVVDIKRSIGEGVPRIEMRDVREATRELVREGEIEVVDGIHHRLADRGSQYPRF